MARGTLWDGRIINSQCFRCHRRYSGPIRMSHIATFSSRRFINRTHKFSQEICIQHLVPDSRRKTKIKTLATGEGWLWIFRRTCIMCNFSSSPTATIFRHFCRAFRTTFVWTWRCSAKQRSQIESWNGFNQPAIKRYFFLLIFRASASRRHLAMLIFQVSHTRGGKL